MGNVTEIGCSKDSDCPTQQSCINSICIDPCSYASPCSRDQECQVELHQPVCVKGK